MSDEDEQLPGSSSEPVDMTEDETLGRGKRVLKSRLITVDGQQVLRLNNYDLEDGEPSVFDRELGDDEAEGTQRRVWQPRAEPAPKKAPTERKAPSAPSVAERNRVSRNDVIKAEKERAGIRCRAVFQQTHKSLFEEFGGNIPEKSEALALLSEEDKEEMEAELVEAKTLKQPEEILIEMRDYQLAGLRWLAAAHANGHSAILADEMGLGKTLQTIAFLAHLKFNLGVKGPHLVLCPLSVLSSWMTEFKRFCPKMRVIKLHSSDMEERERLKANILQDADLFDVVVTTYEMAKSQNMHGVLAQRRWWRYLVIDEGHIIKNENSQISQAVRSFHFGGAILLTGTPLQNNMHELWALLNFLFRDLFPESSSFDSAFNLNGGSKKDDVDPAKLARAHALLKPLMLRRVKSEVEKRLPEKLETTIECPLSDMQQFWYKRLLLKDSALLHILEKDSPTANLASSSGGDWKKLQSLMMQLRKVCNHPHLIPGADAASMGAEDPAAAGVVAAAAAAAGEDNDEAEMVAASGKLVVLDKILHRLFKGGHRSVIFSQFTSMLDILQDYCELAGWRYVRLDGSTNRVQRTVDINSFNAPGSKVFLFLMSTRAGGLGINCQTADTCILYDSDWNPQPDVQAMARVHRIGQTKKVHVYRLVTAGTVEMRILQRAEKKLYLDRMVNQDNVQKKPDEAGPSSTNADEPDASDLLQALTFGAQCCFSAGGGRAPTDDELDAIVDRSRTADATVGGLKGGQQQVTSNYDAAATATKLRELQGVMYGDKNKEKLARKTEAPKGVRELDIGTEWRQMLQEKKEEGKRESKTTTITEYVKGVGLVAVKKANNYTMSEGMRLENKITHRVAVEAGKQIAGRDYEHEGHCMACWDGGELVCCDLCPASYHAECLGLHSVKELQGFGTWGCPHHSCAKCKRKAAGVGGLLFRCAVCPEARCEDHLMESALMVGSCERFLGLGYRHPKQGCYVLCSQECKAWALEQGLFSADTAEDFATAAAIIGATGVDTTNAAQHAREAAQKRTAWIGTDVRNARERLDVTVRDALDKLHAPAIKPQMLAELIDGECSNAARHQAPSHMRKHLLSTSPLAELHCGEVLMLHDLCYDTNLFSTAFHAAAGIKHAAHAAALTALGNWQGPLAALRDAKKKGKAEAKAARGSPARKTPGKSPGKSTSKSAVDEEDESTAECLEREQDVVAEFYLGAMRALETERADTVARIVKVLRLSALAQRVKYAERKPYKATYLPEWDPASLAGSPFNLRASSVAMIALVLTRPVGPAFYFVGERDPKVMVIPLMSSVGFDLKKFELRAGKIVRKGSIPVIPVKAAPKPPLVWANYAARPVSSYFAPAPAEKSMEVDSKDFTVQYDLTTPGDIAQPTVLELESWLRLTGRSQAMLAGKLNISMGASTNESQLSIWKNNPSQMSNVKRDGISRGILELMDLDGELPARCIDFRSAPPPQDKPTPTKKRKAEAAEADKEDADVDLATLSIKELKRRLDRRSISYLGVLERAELVELLENATQKVGAGAGVPAASQMLPGGNSDGIGTSSVPIDLD